MYMYMLEIGDIIEHYILSFHIVRLCA